MARCYFQTPLSLIVDKTAEDYIEMAGGYSQDEDSARVIIAHRDGSFEDIDENSAWYWFGLRSGCNDPSQVTKLWFYLK